MFDEKELANLLTLSRLTIPPEQYPTLSKQLEDILHYFERLSEYDTSHIDVDLGATVDIGTRRRDQERPGLDPDEIRTFSKTVDEDGYFTVPRILGEENG
jgi:aspartyl/glutamyl-tRNA(Asn/Gln) amidotransferase C subunit